MNKNERYQAIEPSLLNDSRRDAHNALSLYHNHVKYTMSLQFTVIAAAAATIALLARNPTPNSSYTLILPWVPPALLLLLIPVKTHSEYILLRYYKFYVSSLIFSAILHRKAGVGYHPWHAEIEFEIDRCTVREGLEREAPNREYLARIVERRTTELPHTYNYYYRIVRWVGYGGASVDCSCYYFKSMLYLTDGSPHEQQIESVITTTTTTSKRFPAVLVELAGPPMLAHKAVHEGKVAAEVIAGQKSAFDARVIPSIAYTDPEVAWVGVTEEQAKQDGIRYGKGTFPWAASGRALALGRSEGRTNYGTTMSPSGPRRCPNCGEPLSPCPQGKAPHPSAARRPPRVESKPRRQSRGRGQLRVPRPAHPIAACDGSLESGPGAVHRRAVRRRLGRSRYRQSPTNEKGAQE